METIILLFFAATLLLSVFLNISVLYALIFGYFLFFGYGLHKKCSPKKLLIQSVSGIRTTRNVLFILLLVGIITALWRAGGTIPYIVYYASQACSPRIMLLMTFLLCSLVSLLTGTSMGTAATIGIILMTMAGSMGISPWLMGGAVMSGIYFGDRCSPMSTSALLVCEITKTDIYRNLVNMVRTSLVPFAITCIAYFFLGMRSHTTNASTNVQAIFTEHFTLHPFVLLPALIIVVFALLRIKVSITMGISILVSIAACLLVQNMSPAALFQTALTGFHPEDSALASLMDGGGIISMLKVLAIVCLSSCYAGIFNETGFLSHIQSLIQHIGQKTTAFFAMLLTAAVTSMIACNQTLSIMLTHQLCEELEPDPEQMAVNLENTSVFIAALIPWSIACATPLAAISAPTVSLLAACYLWLIPLWNLLISVKYNPPCPLLKIKSLL